MLLLKSRAVLSVRTLWLSCLCCLFAIGLKSQQPYFINYNIEDGLASNMVYYVMQDSRGFIWLGTDIGVSFFDGYHFTNFSTDQGLPDNDIFQIHEDSQNRLWFLTMNGKPGYWQNGQFHNPSNDSLLNQEVLSSFLLSFYEDSQQNVYISSRGDGFLKFTADGQVYKEETFECVSRFWGADQHLKILSNNGVYISTPDQSSFSKLSSISANRYLYRGGADDGTLFFGRKDTLYEFEEQGNQLVPLPPIPGLDSEIIHVSKQQNGRYWIGTRDGVFAEQGVGTYQFKKYLEGYSVSCVLEDREGNIWITTLNKGVFFLPAPYCNMYHSDIYFSGLKVMCLELDINQNLWIGTDRNHYFIQEADHFKKHKMVGDPVLEISKIRHFEDGSTWIAGKGNISRYKDDQWKVFPYWTNDVAYGHASLLWLGGPNLMSIQLPELEEFMIPENNFAGKYYGGAESNLADKIILDKRVTELLNIGDELWIGTYEGLYRHAEDSTIFVSQDWPNPLAMITSIHPGKDSSVLFVGTNADGLIVLKDGQLQKNITIEEGISSNICTSIEVDSSGHVFLGTIKGVDQIIDQGTAYYVKNYSKSIGLRTLQVNDLKITNQQLSIATDDGLIYLPLQDTISKQVKPLIHLSKAMVNNRSIPLQQGQSFSPKENALSFDYIGLSFCDRGKLSYQYKLEGYDQSWHTTQLRGLNFRGLPHGDYSLFVKAVNSIGLESDPLRFDFSITPPFWLKSWFFILCMLTIISTFWIIWSVRMKFLKERFEVERVKMNAAHERIEIEKNLIELEQKALRLQMNPHFIFNALNTIKGYYAENKDLEANEYISKFAQLLRLILDNTDPFISLKTELTMLRIYMELARVRYRYPFEFTITVSPELNIYEIGIQPMLLQPFVENAMIHGIASKEGKGTIKISIDKGPEDNLICMIEDDGIGREAAKLQSKHKQHHSKAIPITQDRLAMLQKKENSSCSLAIEDLKNQHGQASGTRIIINLPLKQIW